MSNQILNQQSVPKFSYKQWEKTRNNYLDWLSGFLEIKKKDSLFLWRDFNLLFISLPAKKDVEVENIWFNKINERLNGFSKPKEVVLIPVYIFLFRFITLFIYELFKFLLCKYFIGKSKYITPKVNVYFHSLSSNFINSTNGIIDRHFKFAPLIDFKYNQTSAYTITLVPGINDIIHFINYSKKVNKQIDSLGRNCIILNNYISFSDIINVYYSLFTSWKLFRKEASSSNFKSAFEIANISCADILINEIDKSFLGEIQWALIYGLSFKNWIKSEKIESPIVTYGETLSPMRPVYFFSKQVNSSLNFISIQHSINNRNKIGLFHSGDYFKLNTRDHLIDYSILPDYYLLQGNQFSEIVKEYYPLNRTKIIGCLKYDDLYFFDSKQKEQKKIEIETNIIKNNNKILLIAPSVNDLSKILPFFSNKTIPNWRIIIRPHPANSTKKIEEMLRRAKLKVKIDIITNFSTNDLFLIADLVVCGYSATCYEAIMQNVPAVQIMDLSNMPLIEPDVDIPYFSSSNDFWKWFANFEKMSITNEVKNQSDKIIEKYFYKIDNKSSERLWEYLIEIKNKNYVIV